MSVDTLINYAFYTYNTITFTIREIDHDVCVFLVKCIRLKNTNSP